MKPAFGACADEGAPLTPSDELIMVNDRQEPVGFIGLGTMGEPMALNLVKGGAPWLFGTGRAKNARRLPKLAPKSRKDQSGCWNVARPPS